MINIKYALFLIGLAFLFPFFAEATVGGDAFFSDFNYRSANDDVIFYAHDQGGRGCPPEVWRLDVVSGNSEVIMSCDELELASQEDLATSLEEIFRNTQPLVWIDLHKNGVGVENEVVKEPIPASDLGFGLPGLYKAVIRQDGVGNGSIQYNGCADVYPEVAMFDGLAVPEHPDKLVIVASSIARCEEYGYLAQSVGVAKDLKLVATSSLGRFEAPIWLKSEGRIYPGNLSSPEERVGSVLLTSVIGIRSNVDETHSVSVLLYPVIVLVSMFVLYLIAKKWIL